MFSGVLLLLLVVSSAACREPCPLLLRRLRGTFPNEELQVLVNGRPVEVSVWGGGGAPRAAAALLQAVLRARGYRPRLHAAPADLCRLVDVADLREAAVVAPAVIVPHEGCGSRGSVELLTNFLKPAAISYTLRLWARVPPSRCRSKAGLWTFYEDRKNIDECGFIESKLINGTSTRSCSNCFAVLVRNETSNDREVAFELQSRIEAADLPIQMVYFKGDSLMRKTIIELKRLQKSFLFVDEDLWSDELEVVYVQPPPCAKNFTYCPPRLNSISNLRIGNGWFMKQFASPIRRIVDEFSPKPSQLREILYIESAQNEGHIENAACSWALQHIDEFNTMMSRYGQERRNVFVIKLILCEDDPSHVYYDKISILINEHIFQKHIAHIDFNIYKRKINCLDEENLRQVISENIHSTNLAGVIAFGWYEGVAGAARVAEQGQLPLLLVGAVADEVPLGMAVRAASGRLSDLTGAFHYFLEICGWSRIAIISDNSVYSKSFTESLIKQKRLIYREVIVNSENILAHLEELGKAEARVYILNVNWSLTNDVLNAASKLRMTPNNGFAWIARSWRPIEGNRSNDRGDMDHYTVSLGWRGENLEEGSKYLQSNLRKLFHVNESLAEFIDNDELSMFADALLQLGYGFSRFSQKYPSYKYSLRGDGSALKFSEALENITIDGVTQYLRNRNSSLEHPLIFINKWRGKEAKLLEIFRVKKNGFAPVRPTVLLNSPQLRDRPVCWTITTGDPFAPKCQDVTMAIVTVFSLLSGISLYIARRARLRRLLQREQNIVASLLEIRNRTVSSLNKYLVDRNAIKLLHEIGSGAFGRVHFAELRRSGRGPVVVAAKEPHQEVGPTVECEFLREAYILAPLCHNNIIRLIGICFMNGPPMVLMEHAFYLDLKRYLTERRHIVTNRSEAVASNVMNEVSDESLTRLAREAAGALAYLSTRRLVHRDVRAANCLVDKKRSLKLGDFGMARELDVEVPEYSTIRCALFPVMWMAPESLKFGVFSFATDVWALGVLILEVITLGERPYGDWKTSRVYNYVTAGGLPPLPPDVSKYTSSLLHSCWEHRAENRPSALYVQKYLTQNPRALSPALLNPYPPEPLTAYIK